MEKGIESSSHCPECNDEISLSPAKVGQFLTCPHCDVQLEVVDINPLEFGWADDWMWEQEDEEQKAELEQKRAEVVAHVFCPDCDGRIRFNPHPRLGQQLVCPHCDVDLVVICEDPPDLDWAYVQAAKEWGDIDEDEDDW